MIRTNIVKLTTIPAVAYRQKLPSGGSGVTILRADASQPGIASISKTSGEPVPAANTPADKYPKEAFVEAIALTAGMPYHKQGAVRMVKDLVEEVAEAVAELAPEAAAQEAAVPQEDYEKIAAHYTDKNGKLSYGLLNKDFIKFAASSSVVRRMIANRQPIEEIRAYIAGAKFRSLSGNNKLDDAQVARIVELLDEVSPKGVFKELNDKLRGELAKAKK
ncbi:MAG: hypothetical protein IJJ14_07625 [Coriobacteriales bacterium]|nr:hypothetical protein [Coriobacteriales bacterium]